MLFGSKKTCWGWVGWNGCLDGLMLFSEAGLVFSTDVQAVRYVQIKSCKILGMLGAVCIFLRWNDVEQMGLVTQQVDIFHCRWLHEWVRFAGLDQRGQRSGSESKKQEIAVALINITGPI